MKSVLGRHTRTSSLLLALLSVVLCGEAPQSLPKDAERHSYRLGPDDEVSVWLQDSAEFSGRSFRVDEHGELNLPFIGRVSVAGLTLEETEAKLTPLLEKFFVEPDVILAVSEHRSRPVSVIGAVNKPGIYHLDGPKTLIEVLSLCEGLRSDAGHIVKITRRLNHGRLPLATASVDVEGGFSVGEVNLKMITEASAPLENILIQPEDIVSVLRAKMVYVIGDVEKQGGILLNDRETISVLEAVAMAGGAMRTAAPQNSKILRPILGGPKRAELGLDVTGIMNGRASDIPLLPDDILYVPGSTTKRTASRVLEALIQTGTYAGAVWIGR